MRTNEVSIAGIPLATIGLEDDANLGKIGEAVLTRFLNFNILQDF